jgi:ABC-type branched-subunit amino acid transport system substrate-binding protein
MAFCLIAFILLGNASAFAQEAIKTHTVESLDNYYSLSLKYDVSIEELKLANPEIKSPKPGDVIIIPQKETEDELMEDDCNRMRKSHREVYQIALMMPFYLEQLNDTLWAKNLDPAKINDLSPFRFIQYYHGFMAAADSLRQKGLNVEIYVYDVDHLTSKAYQVLNRLEMKKMDLIVGPFFKSSFTVVAEFARDNKIPVINPLSVRSDILQDNPYVFKLLPSYESQPELVAELVRRDFSDHQVIFYTPNKYQNRELIEQFTQAIERSDRSGNQIVKVVDYATDSIQGFLHYASRSKPNLVIIYSENEVLPSALLSKLSAKKNDYRISVIGLPEWEKFSNIESAYLNTLNTHILMSVYTDYQSKQVNNFIHSYRAKYSDEPLYYAFSGFDAGYFFLGALLTYGKDFRKCLNQLHQPLIQNQFHFEKTNGNGYENTYWNILQYYDYQLFNKSVSWN